MFTHKQTGTADHKHSTVDEALQCEDWRADAEADSFDPDRAYELWLENGGAHAEQIAWENELDRQMSPFDPVWG